MNVEGNNKFYRQCTHCKKKIAIGIFKVGRSVFPGGICYSCWTKTKKVKKVNDD